MRTIYQILLPLLSLFLVRVDLTDLVPLNLKVRVLRIYDGDTVLVKSGSYEWRIRLSRIDAPEMDQPFLWSAAGSAGTYSKKCLEGLLSDTAILKIEKFDMYGRILGDLNEVTFSMVEKGCTTLYPHAEFSDEKEKYRYLHALKAAKARRSGLWKYGGIIQPKKWRSSRKRIAHRQLHQ